MKSLFDVTVMTCSACSNRIEKVLSKIEGINEVNVNLLKNTMSVEYDQKKVSAVDIQDRVSNIGYTARLHEQSTINKESTIDKNDEITTSRASC